ncbi:MAG: ClpXP protease specificity-enhancing factor SspB [Duodenibacillus sp.]
MQSNASYVLPCSHPGFKSHIVQGILDWMDEEGYTPYMLVVVDDDTIVPREYVAEDNTIVLCVSSEATNAFSIERDRLTFQARFDGTVRNLDIPMGRIAALYPKEKPEFASYFPVEETPAQDDRPRLAEDEEGLPIFTKVK